MTVTDAIWASVHPRTSGEHFSANYPAEHITGSSPHRRGTREVVLTVGRGDRFIPAQAGNTCPRLLICCWITVHPRTGGEHPWPTGRPVPPRGSSPHRRGTPERHRCRPQNTRFIPAQAGNTARDGGTSRPPSVHPRTGGEHRRCPGECADSRGSSPHRRGTRADDTHQPAPHRFIPA